MVVRIFAITVAFAIAVPTFAADEKFKEADLVGVWKLTKHRGKPVPETIIATVVYNKDGSCTGILEEKGKKAELKGTWKIDDGKLVVTSKHGDKEIVDGDTIIKLTDDLLVTKTADGEEHYSKVKPDKK